MINFYSFCPMMKQKHIDAVQNGEVDFDEEGQKLAGRFLLTQDEAKELLEDKIENLKINPLNRIERKIEELEIADLKRGLIENQYPKILPEKWEDFRCPFKGRGCSLGREQVRKCNLEIEKLYEKGDC